MPLNGHCLACAPVRRVYRYVDDYLVLVEESGQMCFNDKVTAVLNVFKEHSWGLNFTFELPKDKCIQYLDVLISFSDNRHTCWCYQPRSAKNVLPFDSGHSKVIKRGIATTCIQAALHKSCEHKPEASLTAQIDKLKAAGYPNSVVVPVCESLLQKVKRQNTGPKGKQKDQRPLHVIPYVHKVSHSLKKIATRYDINLLFSAPCKLSKVCVLNCKKNDRPCNIRHEHSFTECQSNVVYEIPLTCGKLYIGQTGQCFNDRARQHAYNVKNGYGSHMAIHCKECKRSPVFHKTRFLKKAKTKHEREIIEAFFIRKASDQCISTPSLHLSDIEYYFLS